MTEIKHVPPEAVSYAKWIRQQQIITKMLDMGDGKVPTDPDACARLVELAIDEIDQPGVQQNDTGKKS